MYHQPFFLGNSKNPDKITELEVYGGQKIAFDESTASLCISEATMEIILNDFLRLDKDANSKISFAEYFGGEKALLSKAENGVSSGEVANVNAKDFILEELKKALKELQKSTQDDKDDIKERALEQGLSALSAAELELFKNQNPLEYEKLKNEQEFAEFNGENEVLGENLSENLALNSNEINGENSNVNLSKNGGESNENSGLNLNEMNENLGETSSDEVVTPARQNALKLLEKALSQDLLAQIKSQNLKIIDLRA